MSSRFVERGGLWVLAQSVLMSAVIALGVIFRSPTPWPGAVLLGAVLMGIGALIALAGVTSLKSGLSPFPKPRDASQLVERGIFSMIRHPLYSSLIITSWGWALFRQSWPTFVAALALTLFLDAKARREERWLRKMFPSYPAYENRVRRFIPWLY